MKVFGNIIWLICGGLISAILHFIMGALLCCTIIFIPFGLQFIKIGVAVIWPFGKEIHTDYDDHPVLNIWWQMFGGGVDAAARMLLGCLLCVTIIGIPFGIQCFKLARLSLIPFGAIVDDGDVVI